MQNLILNETFQGISGLNYRFFHEDCYCDIKKDIFDSSHIHHCYEIYLNISGDISFLHGNEIHKIMPSDIVISAPGDIHHCIYNSSCRHNHYCLWFQEMPDSDFIKKVFESRNLHGAIRLSKNAGQKLISLFIRLERSHNETERSVILMQIFAFLCEDNITVSDDHVPEVDFRVSQILSYIDQNLSSIHSTKDIADAFYISISTLNRIFKNNLNLTVHQIIESKRLSFAEKLLRQGLSVTKACYLSGFSDCSRFISLFKNKFGITPLKYKSLYKN